MNQVLPETVRIPLNVNGEDRVVEVEPRDTLLDTLRDKLDLTGAKKGCNEGVCGTCTVLLEGRAICSCNIFAVEAEGTKITTIEGLSRNGLDSIQKAFMTLDALQCGFCTSGQILAVKSLLSNTKLERPLDEQEIKDALSGNICRCGCYNNIVSAVQSVASQNAGRV